MSAPDDPFPVNDPTLTHGLTPDATLPHLEPLDATLAPGSPQAQPPALPGQPGDPIEMATMLGALDITLAHGGAQVAPAAHAAQAMHGQHGTAPAAHPHQGVPAGAPPQQPTEGRFELLGTLGKGGMGKVYRARDRQIEGRQVALKVLHRHFSADKRFRELFFQEIRAAQGFVSEHVVQVRDTGQMYDGSLFLTMDLVPGEPLSRLLRREGALVPRHAFEIARQMLLGLHSGHEHGLVHKDVKPSNVMLSARVPKTADNPFGIGVRLLDFGIAGLVEDQVEGERSGTPAYMSPEQVQAQRLDARTDLFAVGVCLYEMLVGARPFEGDTLEEVETSLLETRVDPLIRDLRGLPRPIRKILRKALQKDREKRFQSAPEFLRAIERSGVFKPEGELGFLSRAGIVLLTLAAGAEGFAVYHLYEENRELESRVGSVAAVATDQLEAEISDLKQELTQRESDLSRLQERFTETGDLGTQIVDLQRDYDALRDDNSTLQRQNEELQRRVGELETVRREQRFESLPTARTAACFDELLRRIDAGAGRSALQLLQERAKDGVFAAQNLDGRELVYRLAGAAAALETAERDGTVDLRLLEQAGSELRLVRTGNEDFRRRAGKWLAVAPEGETPVDRLANLEATLAALEAAHSELVERGAVSREVAWQQVAEGPADQDPEAAFTYAAMYGVDAIAELVSRYATHLEETVVSDGRLALGPLGAADTLAKWGAWLAGPGAGLTGSDADTLRAFVCARGWYVEREAKPAFSSLFAEPVVAPGEPHHDWRAQLALQLALSRSRAFPLPPDSSLVMRHEWLTSGSVLWFLERLQERSGDSWKIERRIHDVAGDTTGRPQTYEITRTGDTYYTEGIQGLDLRRSDASVRVVNVRTPRLAELPDRPWARGFDVRGYQEFLDEESNPCLVITNGPTEMWFSPRFGLVRESREGVYKRVQVFSSAVR